MDFLLAARRAWSSFMSLLSFKHTTWPRYKFSKLRGIWHLNTVFNVLWMPLQYWFSLGQPQNTWKWFASGEPHCLQQVTLVFLYFSWHGVLKYLITFFQQCSLQSMELVEDHWKVHISPQISSESLISASLSHFSLIWSVLSLVAWNSELYSYEIPFFGVEL